jgi:2-amino-4-hydroxy-6-hydroxymethyldihydropteridine diphosphokinase
LIEWAFISLGSNIQPEKHLRLAAERLLELGEQVYFSHVYQSTAVGPIRQEDFLNAAAKLCTDFDPLTIRRRLRQIEAALGRIRTEDKYAPRTIDLDLCLLGDRILRTESLVLPDPGLLVHPHLVVPMAELDPEFPHPETMEPLGRIAQRLKEKSKLTRREDVKLDALDDG